MTRTKAPSCLVLPPTLEAFGRAAAELVRPYEVSHLVLSPASPEQVGHWIASQRRNGGLHYIPDQTRTLEDGRPSDHWCSPAATLERQGGDCEDLSILAVSLLRASGLEAWVCVGWRHRRTVAGTSARRESHAWVMGQRHDGDPFFMEATTGRVLPDLPDAYQLVKPLR